MDPAISQEMMSELIRQCTDELWARQEGVSPGLTPPTSLFSVASKNAQPLPADLSPLTSPAITALRDNNQHQALNLQDLVEQATRMTYNTLGNQGSSVEERQLQAQIMRQAENEVWARLRSGRGAVPQSGIVPGAGLGANGVGKASAELGRSRTQSPHPRGPSRSPARMSDFLNNMVNSPVGNGSAYATPGTDSGALKRSLDLLDLDEDDSTVLPPSLLSSTSTLAGGSLGGAAFGSAAPSGNVSMGSEFSRDLSLDTSDKRIVTPASIMNMQHVEDSRKKPSLGRNKKSNVILPHKSGSPDEATSIASLYRSKSASSPTYIAPDGRRSSHKVAEQRRRDSLKNCFEDLRRLLPPVDAPEEATRRPGEGNVGGMRSGVVDPENPNRGISKVALLRRANEYLLSLRERIDRRDIALDAYRATVKDLRKRLGEEPTDAVDGVDLGDLDPEMPFHAYDDESD